MLRVPVLIGISCLVLGSIVTTSVLANQPTSPLTIEKLSGVWIGFGEDRDRLRLVVRRDGTGELYWARMFAGETKVDILDLRSISFKGQDFEFRLEPRGLEITPVRVFGTYVPYRLSFKIVSKYHGNQRVKLFLDHYIQELDHGIEQADAD